MNKTETLFAFGELSAWLLNFGDFDIMQTLLKSCDDFSILITGMPYEPNTAKDLLLGCLPGIGLKNKYVIGFIDQRV